MTTRKTITIQIELSEYDQDLILAVNDGEEGVALFNDNHDDIMTAWEILGRVANAIKQAQSES